MNKQQKMTKAAEVLAKAMKEIDGLTPLPATAEENVRGAFETLWWSAGQAMICGGDDDLAAHDLWALCGRLGRLVEARRPGSALAGQFAEALVQEADGEVPDVEAMQAAVDAFDALPEQERREILAGWAPVERSDRERYADVTHNIAFHDVLAIEAAGNGDVRGAIECWPDPDGTTDVRVLIAHGTPREQVLAALDAIRAKLESDWQALTAPEAAAAEEAA